jgi:DNA-binding transcriptional MerR regulator
MTSAAPVGRPEKYTTHVQPHLEEIKVLRQRGMKLDAIAKHLDISRDTLNEYQKQYSELSDVLTTAKEKLHADMLIKAEESLMTLIKDREVTEVTIESGIGKDGPYEKTIERTRIIPPNPTAVIFTLKNRDPENWKDRTELDARVLHSTIPQPLAPVREDDIIEGEVIQEPKEIESPSETDHSVQ